MENNIVASLTVFSQLFILLLLGFLAFGKKGKIPHLISKHSVFLAFTIALSASVISLFYSEIKGLVPCKLCWLQRIFMFPLAIILGMAFWKGEDRHAADYSIALSLIGASIGIYQYYGQMFNPAILTCTAADPVSCATKYFVSFGYITIPMMSITAFLLIASLLFFQKRWTSAPS